MPPPFYKWKKPQILFGMWDPKEKKKKGHYKTWWKCEELTLSASTPVFQLGPFEANFPVAPTRSVLPLQPGLKRAWTGIHPLYKT